MRSIKFMRGLLWGALLGILLVMQGCYPSGDGTARVAPKANVWRLTPAVFAGNSAPPPELTSGSMATLQPGGWVTTDQMGEAKLQLLDPACTTTLYIYQNGSLKCSTCTKKSATSGNALCSMDGMTSIINNCLSKIDIQTPSSSTTTSGTWFSVIYLPEEQLSIVQVYEGQVTVSALIDPEKDAWTPGMDLPANSFWFTAPGEQAPFINGLEGRQALRLEDWQRLRLDLIDRYPDLDRWMEATRLIAKDQSLSFPDYLSQPADQINVQFVGPLWSDERILRAVTVGIDWNRLTGENWPDFEVTPRLFAPNAIVEDARRLEFNRDESIRLLSEADYWRMNAFINIVMRDQDHAAGQFAESLRQELANLKIDTEVFAVDAEQFRTLRAYADPQQTAPFILLETSGEHFGTAP